MTYAQLADLLGEALEVDAATLTPATEIAAVEEWNSLGWLSVMSLLDERLDVSLSAAEIRSLKTVQNVVDLVGSKVAVSR